MVQSLNNLISEINPSDIITMFSTFCCEKDKDVELFLKEKAIDYENRKLARTFLVFDDEALKKNKVVLTGYFAITIKSLLFSPDISTTMKKKLTQSSYSEHTAGYLIGQLARNDSAPKGIGSTIVTLALRTISAAQELAGGRFVFLDCKKELRPFYESQKFKFMQTKENADEYIQMYMLL